MKRLKRILTVILIGVLTLGIMSLLSGCFGIKFGCYGSSESDTVPRYADPWKYKKEDQGFYYAVYSKEGKKTATILGLIDEEKEIEELVIPEKLGGYDVQQIGVMQQRLSAPSLIYGIEADQINNIIINHKVTILDCGIMVFRGNLIINSTLEFSFAGYREELIHSEKGLPLEKAKSIQFNIDADAITDYEVFVKRLTMRTQCEVILQFLDGALKTNSIILKRDTKLIEPKTPTKKEYIFKGWYRDKEYTTEWNFEEDKVTENTTLYAKWSN